MRIITALATQRCKAASIIETAPAIRFSVNGDGTATDKQTGLIWAQCQQGLSGASCDIGTPTTHTWSESLALTQPTSAPSSPNDWRLPNIKELLSIVEFACGDPSINDIVFPNTSSSFFWSASPSSSNSDFVWGVDFINGFVVIYGRANTELVRLVRGGSDFLLLGS